MTRRQEWWANSIAAVLIVAILSICCSGCAAALDVAVKAQNAATIALVEGRPLVEEGIAKDVAAGHNSAQLERDWRTVTDAFDRLVDATLALRRAVKAARAAEAMGGDVDGPHLLALAAEVTSAFNALLDALPELRGLL